jgi:uncharacterized membrane protein YeiH
VQLALDLIGIFAFAVSGALLAAQKRFDVVGVVMLAEITALGGGIARDLVIGAVPPAAFRHAAYLLVPLAAAAFVFFAHPHAERIRTPLLVFDAAGLALFTVAGTAKAASFGLGAVAAVALGVITAVGGGILRDVLAGDVPVVFRQDSVLYTIPAFLAAVVVAAAHAGGFYGPEAATAAVLLAFVLRMLALWRGWLAPKPR